MYSAEGTEEDHHLPRIGIALNQLPVLLTTSRGCLLPDVELVGTILILSSGGTEIAD